MTKRIRDWQLAAIGTLAVVNSVFAQQAPPLLRRLDDPRRAKVLAALAGLIILGFAMVLLAWIGARMAQRYRHGAAFFRSTPRPGEHDWARKPLQSPTTDDIPNDRPPGSV